MNSLFEVSEQSTQFVEFFHDEQSDPLLSLHVGSGRIPDLWGDVTATLVVCLSSFCLIAYVWLPLYLS